MPKSTSPAVTGPFKYKIIACGKLTTAQMNAAGTADSYGAIVQAKNISQQTLEPQFTVRFLRGTMVDGENYTNEESPGLAPGESQNFEVDISKQAGTGRPGDTCKITEEDIFKPGTPTSIATYYP